MMRGRSQGAPSFSGGHMITIADLEAAGVPAELIIKIVKTDTERRLNRRAEYNRAYYVRRIQPAKKLKKLKSLKDTEKVEFLPQFEQFYSVYPKKTAKRAAMAKFIAAINSGVSPEKMAAAAKNYAEACRRDKVEAKFIKAPDTWLNKGCYDDILPNGQAYSSIQPPSNLRLDCNGKWTRDPI
jgi:hypothetical protein